MPSILQRGTGHDLGLGACLLALSGYIWHETAGYPQPSGEAMVEGLGPAFYPRLLAVVLAGLTCLVVASALLRRPGTTQSLRPEATPPGPRPAPLRAVTLLAILVAYRLLMPVLGYPLCTFAALVGTMALLGGRERRRRAATWGVMAACAGVATVGVYLIFARVVKVPIPMGALFGG